MIFDKHHITVTPSSGSSSTTLPSGIHGLLRMVSVSPTTSTTTYDISLTDKDAYVIYERTGEVGDLSEVVQIPVMRDTVLAIANASVDEVFSIRLTYQTS